MNTEILNDAKTALRVLNKLGLKPIIAGGALRDLTVGRPLKDIDIIVKDHKDIDSTIHKLGKDMGYNFASKSDCSGASGASGNHSGEAANRFITENQITEVMVLTKEGKPSIDFIIVSNDPVERVKYFPCNGSMIWMDAVGNVHMRPEFMYFWNDKEMMFFPTATQDYTIRMMQYFPSYKVKVNLGDMQGALAQGETIPF